MATPTRAPGNEALTKLEGIVELDLTIQEAKAQLDALYRQRDQLYIEAQEAGATLAEIATAAGVSRQGLLYMMRRAKARPPS